MNNYWCAFINEPAHFISLLLTWIKYWNLHSSDQYCPFFHIHWTWILDFWNLVPGATFISIFPIGQVTTPRLTQPDFPGLFGLDPLPRTKKQVVKTNCLCRWKTKTKMARSWLDGPNGPDTELAFLCHHQELCLNRQPSQIQPIVFWTFPRTTRLPDFLPLL